MDKVVEVKEQNISNIFLIRFVVFLSKKIEKLNNKVESIHGRWLEVIGLLLYGILHMIMSIYHEPWYDEAVAWQIAKCTSIRQMLFEVPHYEGHPPLWHLILALFAKNGAPYELSLTLVSLAFTLGAVWMILFKSPFPRILKLLLPFTYFMFYQYGVISRPYCMMMLAMMLLAYFYKTRNEKPLAYVLSMVFLCLTSAYGILIAGSIAFVWVLEIVNPKQMLHKLKKDAVSENIKIVLKDRRIWLLFGLLLYAICLCIILIPQGDTYATSLFTLNLKKNNIVIRLLYTLILMPADAIYTNAYRGNVYLMYYSFDFSDVIFAFLIGCLFLLFVYIWGKKKGIFLLYIIPHCVIAVFFACVYGYVHHIGIETLLILFWLWVCFDCKIDKKSPQEKKKLLKRTNPMIRNGSVLLMTASVIMSIYWTICSCAIDIKEEYAIGRNEAQFIKENHLEKYNIMIPWSVAMQDEERVFVDTNTNAFMDNILAYFDDNILYNVGFGLNARGYSSHRVATEAENENARQNWRSKGLPDVIIGIPDMEWVFGDEFLEDEYIAVWYHYVYMPWKDEYSMGNSIIMVRKQLAEKLGLEEVEMIDQIKGHVFDQSLGE